MQSQNNKNNLVIIVGLGLILLVSLATVFRSRTDKSEEKKSEARVETVEDSNLITASDLKKRISDRENFSIIDIREKESFLIEHIPGSTNIALEELDQKEITDTGKTIVIIDYDGKNGVQALKILKSKDIKNALFLSGGILAWKENRGSTISWGDPTSFTDQAKVTFISSDDLKKLIDSSIPFLIIDARDSKSFSEGKIPKAFNYPLTELENNKEKISNNQQIIVYGNTELESFQAAVRLYDLNFFAVKALSGGLKDWKSKNYPIEK